MQKNIDDRQVILSMHSYMWKLIASGLKIVEFRTTKPKCAVPFKVYVIATKGGGVVGEFVCNNILEISSVKDCINAEKQSYIYATSIFEYTKRGRRKVYGWKISDVKAYLEPLDISKFGLSKTPRTWQYIERKE